MKTGYPKIYSHNNDDIYVSSFGDPNRAIYYTEGYFLTEADLKRVAQLEKDIQALLSAKAASDEHQQVELKRVAQEAFEAGGEYHCELNDSSDGSTVAFNFTDYWAEQQARESQCT